MLLYTHIDTHIYFFPHLFYMTNRDVVLSICSLVLGAALGASSVLYAQEVAYSGVPTEAARTGEFHRAPEHANPKQYRRRSVHGTNRVLPRVESAARPTEQ